MDRVLFFAFCLSSILIGCNSQNASTGTTAKISLSTENQNAANSNGSITIPVITNPPPPKSTTTSPTTIPTKSTTTSKPTDTPTTKPTSPAPAPSSSTPNPPPTTHSPPPSTTPSSNNHDRSFDLPSFIGGVILSLGLAAIGYVVYKFYRTRTDPNYRTL